MSIVSASPRLRLRRSAAATLALAALLGGVGEVAVTTATATAASASTIDSLTAGGTLFAGDVLRSPSGQVYATMQDDGNFVVYRTTGASSRAAIWSSGTANQPGAYVTNQGDGNLVIYKPVAGGGRVALWASGTGGREAARLLVQDDDNLVLYGQASGAATWSWKTGVINAAPGGVSALQQRIVSRALGEVGTARGTEGAGNCNYYSSQVGSGAASCTLPGGFPGRQEAWCAQFVRWVLAQAGAQNQSLNAGARSITGYSTWRTGADLAGVQPGDVVGFRLFDKTSRGVLYTDNDHVAIVVAVNGNDIWTVEGNGGGTGTPVQKVLRHRGDAIVSGYARAVAR